MMSSLGSKKNVKIFSLALAGVFIASIAGMALVSMGDVANAYFRYWCSRSTRSIKKQSNGSDGIPEETARNSKSDKERF